MGVCKPDDAAALGKNDFSMVHRCFLQCSLAGVHEDLILISYGIYLCKV